MGSFGMYTELPYSIKDDVFLDRVTAIFLEDSAAYK
jgi:hypothetical protein